jgi:hypothetical protein
MACITPGHPEEEYCYDVIGGPSPASISDRRSHQLLRFHFLTGKTIVQLDIHQHGGWHMNKRFTLWSALLSAFLFFAGAAPAQLTGDYRSSGTGTWNAAGTWERYDGSAWVPAAVPPTSTDNAITVQSPHVVTVTASVTVDQVSIAAGAQVIVNSGVTLTLNNGTGTDLTVSGTFTNSGTIAGTGTTTFAAASFYQHTFTTTAGTIPTATWGAGSTCEIIGYTTNTAAPAGLGQAFSNFTWNAPLQTGAISAAGAPATVNGTFTMTSTGTGSFKFATTTSPTITIGGDFVQTGGTCVLTGSTGSPILNLAGNFAMSGGTLRLSEGTGIGTMNVSGNVSHTGGTITETSTGSGAIKFAKAGTQTFTGGGTIQNSINFTVNSGSTLQTGTAAITGGGSFTLSSGAALSIGSPDGITTTGATGNIQVTGTRTFGTGADYLYTGLSAQAAGNGLPATVRNLTLDNPSGLTLASGLTTTGFVLLSQGTLSIGNLNLSIGGNWTNNGGALAAGTGSVTFTGAAKIIGGTTPTAFPGLVIAAGATTTLATNASATGLSFAAGTTASSLTHNGGTALSISGNATIAQPTGAVTAAWNVNQGSATVTGNVAIGGSNTTTTRISRLVITTGSLTIGGNLTFNSSATTAQTAVLDLSTGGGTGSVSLAGLFTLTNNTGTLLPGTSGSTFNFTGTGAGQTVVLGSAVAYNNLLLNNTNPAGATLGAAVTAAKVSGDLRIQSGILSNGGFAMTGNAAKTFEVADGATFRLTGTSGMAAGFGTRTFGAAGTVEYAGPGAQTIAAENYGNLSITGSRGSSSVTLTGAGTIGISGAFSPTATFTTGSYGTSGSTVEYRGAGAQTVAAFGYNNLFVSGARGTENIIFSPGGTIGVLGTFTPSATFSGGSFVTTGSTVDFNGAAQSIPFFPYHHLSGNGSGAKTITAGITINGDLTIGSGTTLTAGSFTHILKGNLSHIGTLTPGTGTLEFAGPTTQTVSGNPLAAWSLTVNNPSGITLAGVDLSIAGTLTLTAGALTTGANVTTIAPGGAVARTSGYVAGNLKKSFAAGTLTHLFEVGSGGSYAPVTLSFESVTAPGAVLVHTTTGDHPSIATSGIRAARSVNRYYTCANAGVGFISYDATFGFAPADVDPGANTGAFVVRRYAAPAWSAPVTGTRTTTSTQATGLSAFGEFQVGEGGAAFPGTSLVDAAPASVTANGSSSSTVTVRLKDDQGNNLTSGGDNVSLTSSIGTPGGVTDNGNGTYTAPVTSTVTGQAVIRGTVNSGLILDSAVVQFTPGSVSLATSNISANPTSIIANGGSTSRITVQLRDAFGNNLIAGAGTVLLTTNHGTIGAVTDSTNGRYSALLTSSTSLDTARVTGTLNGSPLADDALVAFVEGAPVSVAWIRDPRDTVAGAVLGGSGGSPAVEIRDASGFRVVNATNAVTVGFAANPGATTLGGNVTRNAVDGVAVFDNLTITKAATGYTLEAVSGTLLRDTSGTFAIRSAAATALAFTQQPGTTVVGQPITPAVAVRLRDAYGNDVAAAGVSVTLALASGTGTLSGTTTRTTDATGTASFPGLSLNATGTKRLSAAATGLSGGQSNFFIVIVAPSSLVSDDFNSYSLNTGLWTVINPLNDAEIATTATNTVDASVAISVPAAVSHDAADGGLRVPRIMQTTNNTDFEVEAKFLSPVSLRFQLQGIIVEQDSLNFLRFDINSDGLSTKVFASKVVGGVQTQIVYFSIGVNGVTPQYLRVRRVGNDWTQFYSLNGVAWNPTGTFTHALTVQRVGLFTGNVATTPPEPAHTGLFDYFFNTSSPVVPEDGSVAVDSLPPVLTNIAVAPGDTSALFTWTTNEQSDSRVTYGLTPALELGTVTDTSIRTSHTLTLNGLLAQRPYHFRVASRDLRNNTGAGPDSTFATKDSSTIVSDDFNTFVLNSHWSFVNPQGAGTLAFIGQNTPNAWARLIIPGGTTHEPWTAGNTSPRIMQPANNRDFEIETKFESPVLQQYQIQGLLVEQDSTNYLRFDLNSNGSGTRIFGGTVVNGIGASLINMQIAANGTVPQYLRITRQGALWTLRYSLDGSVWTTAGNITQTFTVQRVGVFGGNSGTTPPAHTVDIDYFFKTSSPVIPEDGGSAGGNDPPVISNVQTSTTGSTATISWTTNEAATGRVFFGPTSAYENGSAGDTVLHTSHTFTLHALNPAALYHFRIRTADVYGDSSFTGDSTFTTGAASTIVSDDFNTFVLDSTRWKFFNPRGDAVRSMTNTNTDSARLVITIPGGLTHEPWTGGNFAPRVMQAANNTDFEVEVKFESPLLQRFQIQGVLVEQGPGDYIRFDLNSDGTNTKIFAATVAGGTATTRITATAGANGLSPQWLRVRREGNLWIQSYSFNGIAWTTAGTFTQVLAMDSIGVFIGNTGTTIPAHTGKVDYFFNTRSPIVPEDGGIAPDPLPPVFSAIQAATTPTTATITWTTNEPASSSVSYGPTTAYENGTVTDPGRVVSHNLLLTGLTPFTTYHYRVGGTDSSGNAGTASDSLFVTKSATTITSDDFNRSTLDSTRWTFINPLGDGSVTMANTGTDSASVVISVPAGVAHDVWTGVKTVPRIMQPANDVDFEVIAKYISRVNQRFQVQGLLVEQSATEFLRFDFNSDGSVTKIFAASFTGGTATTRLNLTAGANGIAPQWMRIRRVGSQWTLLYSFNGSTWTTAGTFTFALAVSAIGPFAGNTGTTIPAHAARIDYFFNADAPIIPEDGTPDTTRPVIAGIQKTPGLTSFQVQWTTNEPARGTVHYGLTSSYELGAVTNSAYALSQSVTVPGLVSGTTYHFRCTATDTAGNAASTADSTITTLPPYVAVSPRLFLQGPYNAAGDSMTTDLLAQSLLPRTQPYGGAPWNYAGQESVATVPPGIVDWVLLELRLAAESTVTAVRRAAFLKQSGVVVDLDGVSPVACSGVTAGSFWIVVKHRNHLGIMSAVPVALSMAVTDYDFRSSSSAAFGTDPMRALEPGVFGMRSGDGNSDGGVDAFDRNTVWRPQNGTAWAYSKYGDFNLDGGIDALDLNLQWRPNNGTASQVPEPGFARSFMRGKR